METVALRGARDSLAQATFRPLCLLRPTVPEHSPCRGAWLRKQILPFQAT